MLSEARQKEIADWFEMDIQGGSATDFMSLIDAMIEDGFLSEEEFEKEELEIARIFDDGFLHCDDCGWVFPNSSRAYDRDNICEDCEQAYE